MPVYIYSNDDRSLVLERLYPMGKAPASIRADGEKLTIDIALQWKGRDAPKCWDSANGQYSLAGAVHPDQIPEAIVELKHKTGRTYRFDDKGRPFLPTRAARKDYCKARGIYDKDGGYGDAAPDHHTVTNKERRFNARSRGTGSG